MSASTQYGSLFISAVNSNTFLVYLGGGSLLIWLGGDAKFGN